MPNHVHLIATPDSESALAQAMGRLLSDYARYFNMRRLGSGHLWQARYYSSPMEPVYCWKALAYVERNPVRAGLADTAAGYPWSSAPARLGRTLAPDWLEMESWRIHWTPAEWKAFLETGGDKAFDAELRDVTMKGYPMGTALAQRLEQQHQRR